jgi:hypothetical protein
VTPKNNTKDENVKAMSQRITCLRLGIENVFSILKKNRILVDKWKKSLEEHHQVFVYLAYLHNREISSGRREIRGEEFLRNNKVREATTFFGNFNFTRDD